MDSVYQVPARLEEQQFAQKLLRRLGVEVMPRARLTDWDQRVARLTAPQEVEVRVGIVAKYHAVGDYSLSDAYVSVVEALHHVEAAEGVRVTIEWIDAEDLEAGPNAVERRLNGLNGVIIPQGWGLRGGSCTRGGTGRRRRRDGRAALRLPRAGRWGRCRSRPFRPVRTARDTRC